MSQTDVFFSGAVPGDQQAGDKSVTDKDVEQVLKRLSTYYPVAIDMGLDRIVRLLGDLDNPHLKLPPVIHIAGTNGKGSTLSFFKAMLEASGKKVHAFTSPHLVRYNERVVLAGEEISNDFLIDVLEECERANKDRPITFFEITAVASFLAFSKIPADVILLETGMGGRLDATNVVPNPALTVITMISNDHGKFLGSTLPQIAGEKAGILKPCAPCILGPQTKDALASGVDIVVEQKAVEVGADIHIAGMPEDEGGWLVRAGESGFTFTGLGRVMELPFPAMLGDHQILNAGTAVAGLLRLKQTGNPLWQIEEDAIRKGIQTAHWPARMQRLDDHEEFLSLPENCELWLDGGHNDSAGAVLADQARKWRQQDDKEFHIVMAMLTTKTPEEFLEKLAPLADRITVIPVPNDPLSFEPRELEKRIGRMDGIKADISKADDWLDAIRRLTASSGSKRILTCGSLYLAGDVLKHSR